MAVSTQASISVYVAHRSLRTLSERFCSSLAVVSVMGASTSRITVSNPQSDTSYMPIHNVMIHCRVLKSISTHCRQPTTVHGVHPFSGGAGCTHVQAEVTNKKHRNSTSARSFPVFSSTCLAVWPPLLTLSGKRTCTSAVAVVKFTDALFTVGCFSSTFFTLATQLPHVMPAQRCLSHACSHDASQ